MLSFLLIFGCFFFWIKIFQIMKRLIRAKTVLFALFINGNVNRYVWFLIWILKFRLKRSQYISHKIYSNLSEQNWLNHPIGIINRSKNCTKTDNQTMNERKFERSEKKIVEFRTLKITLKYVSLLQQKSCIGRFMNRSCEQLSVNW